VYYLGQGRDDELRHWWDVIDSGAAKFVAEGLKNHLTDEAVNRGMQTFGRFVFHPSEYTLSGAGHGNLIGKVVEEAGKHPNIQVWDAPVNEFFAGTGELARRAERDIDHMVAMERLHRKAGIGLFALGTPKVEDWHLYKPALARCIANGHYLSLNEYASPMQYLVGPNQAEFDGAGRLIGGKLVSAVDNWGHEEGWTTLRFVKVLRAIAALGLDVSRLNIDIAENGNDLVTGRQPWPGRGWKDHASAWWITDARFGPYPKQLAWYCRHAGHFPQIKAVFPYAFAVDPAKWGDFETYEIVDAIATEVRSLPKGHTNVPASQPEPGTRVFYEKVAWATEEAARILKREGMLKAHDYIVAQYVKDAIAHRDALPNPH